MTPEREKWFAAVFDISVVEQPEVVGESPTGFQDLPIELQQQVGSMLDAPDRDALFRSSKAQAQAQVEMVEIDRLIDDVRHCETVDELFARFEALPEVDETRPSLRAGLVTAMAKRLRELERTIRDDEINEDRLRIFEGLLDSIQSTETGLPPPYLAEPIATLAGVIEIISEEDQPQCWNVLLALTGKVSPDQCALLFEALASQIGTLAVGARLPACRAILRNISNVPEAQRAPVLVLVTQAIAFLFDDFAQSDAEGQVEIHAKVRGEVPKIPEGQRGPLLFELADILDLMPENACAEAHTDIRHGLAAIPKEMWAPTLMVLAERLVELHPGEPRSRAHADLRALAPSLPKNDVGPIFRILAVQVSGLLHDDQQAARTDLLTGIEDILDEAVHLRVLTDLTGGFDSLPDDALGQPCLDILESAKSLGAGSQRTVLNSLIPHLSKLSGQEFATCAKSCPRKLWRKLRDQFPDRLASLLGLERADVEKTMPTKLYEAFQAL
jgi:hypothetical protein